MFSEPLHKQLRAAIVEGNEDKAIGIYQAKELGKSLISTLHPSKPFPSKKNPHGETPMELAAISALSKLFAMFLEYGGRPDIKNSRKEGNLHVACSLANHPARREELVEQMLKWRSVNPATKKKVLVNVDDEDLDGNTAMHLAARNGLQACVMKLILGGANLSVLNHQNYTCAEFADVSGKANFGSMIELAWLYRGLTAIDGDLLKRYDNFFEDRSNASIMVDSHSMTPASLTKFLARLIAYISEETGEPAARSEVMLMHYRWNAAKLLKDYNTNPARVFSSINILPRSDKAKEKQKKKIVDSSQALVLAAEKKAEETALIVQTANTVPVGVTIDQVFFEPQFADAGPFAVYRNGKKVTYSVRNVNGKSLVVPLDFDPNAKLLCDDQNASTNSHIKPDTTATCPMCGELMYEPASVQHFLSGDLVEPKHRELACGSGHKYCFSCWSGFLEAHVTGDGLECLRCPGFKCGEMLDLHWAPVLLQSTDLVNRMLAQRQHRVIDLVKLQWCPAPKCGLLVHVHQFDPEHAPVTGEGCTAGYLPQSSVCAHGHGFCLVCGKEAHPSITCDEVDRWRSMVKDVSKFTNKKVEDNPFNVLLSAPKSKKCPHCVTFNQKVDGCNHIRCTNCHKSFCWSCQQDWSKHLAGTTTLMSGDDDSSAHHEDDHSPKGAGGKSPRKAFRCNLSVDPMLADEAVLEEKAEDGMEFLLDEKNISFLRHFIRYQIHMESFILESGVYRDAVARVNEALTATQERDIPWLLGEEEDVPRISTTVPAGDADGVGPPADDDDTVLEAYYLPREKAVEFLIGAFEELEKCRLMLRWSYVMALYHIDENFAEKPPSNQYRHSFEETQNSLEAKTEVLSDYICHRRLRGSKSDILAATVSARSNRIEFENLIVTHNCPGSADNRTMRQMKQVAGASGSERMDGGMAASASAPYTVEENDSDSDEDVHTYSDASWMKINTIHEGNEEESIHSRRRANIRHLSGDSTSSGEQQQQQVVRERMTRIGLEAERSGQEQQETTTTVRRTIVQKQAVQHGSGSSLISELTTPPEVGDSKTTTNNFQRVSRMNTASSEDTPSPMKKPPPARTPLGMAKQDSIMNKSVRQLSKAASKVWDKAVIEYISEEEAVLVYAIMSEQRVDREKAVHIFLDDHDTRLYNPKAVYLFPGETYTPKEEEEEEEEEEEVVQQQFGRVEYNRQEDSESEESVVEQRLIGVKKDPDQEALEHAMLLSSQEQEFGINMYDSLTGPDEEVLADYVSQGFTRSEAALIIFEEKFGQVSGSKNSQLIPAMPTLHAVHEEEIADDDPEVEDLILRGYTREQAIAVIRQHRERARQAALNPANQHADPTHFDPHPAEERFQLSEREESEVENIMQRRMCSRFDAVEFVVSLRASSSSSTTNMSQSSYGSGGGGGGYSSQSYYEQTSREASSSDMGDYEVRRYMDQGYTRDQAMQMVRRNQRRPSGGSMGSNSNSQSFYSQQSSNMNMRNTSQYSSGGSQYGGFQDVGYDRGRPPAPPPPGPINEETEVQMYMSQGYSYDQAWQLVRRQHQQNRGGGGRTVNYY
mmetsp:Transcript_4015/g.6337  ORF Transcript_4015/g.6337 Transcript_4015/m.6337 type:complete len:1555 (-) Transcript_4015:955-5619(-)